MVVTRGSGHAPTDSAVRIAVLYPELLGTYGDGGNATILAARLRWRGIAAQLVTVAAGTAVPDQCDLYLLGGGEDLAQHAAGRSLVTGGGMPRAVTAGAPVLAVCAGLQLLGHYVEDRTGVRHPGLGLLDVATRPRLQRATGELLARGADGQLGLLSGFENHQGGTVLGAAASPLATVIRGTGNGGGGRASGTEGVVQGRIIGTYLHGPVLARNPALADHLLELALGMALPPLELPAVVALRSERIAAARRGLARIHALAAAVPAAVRRAAQWRPAAPPRHA